MFRADEWYDEDGNEIPDDDLPWNIVYEDVDPNDTTKDWQYDEIDTADQLLEGSKIRVAQNMREEALRRLELSARTTTDFQNIVSWYDREEQSRMRKERRYEMLRGDVPLDYDTWPDGATFPSSISQPTFKQICRGEFDDFLANCLYEMHDLTDKEHLREIVMNLKLDHKEIVYFLGIRLYPTKKLASLRNQSERNIRKVRGTVQRRVQRQLYQALIRLQKCRYELTHQEQTFIKEYQLPDKKGEK